MTIGERIQQRRTELGMTQEDLALALGYKSRSSINKIEKDERSLTQSKIKAIADALQTTPGFIMGWEDRKDEAQLRRLLAYYNAFSEIQKAKLVSYAEGLSEQED